MKKLVAALVFAGLGTWGGTVSAGPISYFTGGVPTAIPGLTGFSTTGSMMDGMSVTACFATVGCETRAWADTGASSGGVTGNGWGLSVNGDTFTVGIWSMTLDNVPQTGQLVSLLLDGRGSFTIFDRTDPNQGTPGSAQGRDWDSAAGGAVNVTYLDVTNIIGDGAVGDLYQQVLIEFLDRAGPSGNFVFSQDTDNDSRLTRVPEPGSLALLGLGLAAFAAARRRKH